MNNHKAAMQRHIGNIQRAAGNKSGGSEYRYEYILSQDDLMKSYFESHKDLAYALRKEVKRDRYIMNADGLKKDIDRICKEAINAASKELAAMIAHDIQKEVTMQLNGAIQGRTAGAAASKTSSFTMDLSKSLVGGLVSGVRSIFDDMLNSEDY